MNQYNLIDNVANQYWYLDTEDRSAEVLSGKVYSINLYWHRAEGPAYIDKSGTQKWFINDKRHRLDGPAYIGADGSQSWWVNGIWCRNNKSFQEAAGITDEEMMIVILKYGNVE